MITISFPECGRKFILENGDGNKHRFPSPKGVAEKILTDFPEEAASITHGFLEQVSFLNIEERDKNDIIRLVRQGFQMKNFEDIMENY